MKLAIEKYPETLKEMEDWGVDMKFFQIQSNKKPLLMLKNERSQGSLGS
jgi:hypothetical protein